MSNIGGARANSHHICQNFLPPLKQTTTPIMTKKILIPSEAISNPGARTATITHKTQEDQHNAADCCQIAHGLLPALLRGERSAVSVPPTERLRGQWGICPVRSTWLWWLVPIILCLFKNRRRNLIVILKIFFEQVLTTDPCCDRIARCLYLFRIISL